MNSYYPSRAQADGAPTRYSGKHSQRPIRFFCHAPQAHQVCLVGDFNQWTPGAHPLQRGPDGSWFLEVILHLGHHQYLFLVDNLPTLDPKAQGVARDPQGRRVSMISVG